MDAKDFVLFKRLLGLTQPEVKKTMEAFLRKRYKKVESTDDYVYAVGNIPIALVAHMDTVFPTPAKEVYYDREEKIIWSPDGLGADDRAGVFAIIRILQAGFKPHVILTTDEEKGALGATMLTIEHEKPFAKMKYLIQLDRRGEKDCVFYDCANDKFTKYIESFGFETAWGTFSDISEICPIWKVAGVNLSVGYRNEHSNKEVLKTTDLLNTIEKVKKMLADHKKAKYYEFIMDPFLEKYVYGYGNYNSTSWSRFMKQDDYMKVKCHKCGKTFFEHNTIPVKTADGTTVFYCGDCLSFGVEWCDKCQEAFELNPTNLSECDYVDQNGNVLILCHTCRKEPEKLNVTKR